MCIHVYAGHLQHWETSLQFVITVMICFLCYRPSAQPYVMASGVAKPGTSNGYPMKAQLQIIGEPQKVRFSCFFVLFFFMFVYFFLSFCIQSYVIYVQNMINMAFLIL